MPPYATVLKRIQPMPNVPLAYVSVYRPRMSDIFHTLAYASTIRNSVTGPLPDILQKVRKRRSCSDLKISWIDIPGLDRPNQNI